VVVVAEMNTTFFATVVVVVMTLFLDGTPW